MNTYTPHGRYTFCLDVKGTVFGSQDARIVLFPDFECEVDVDCELIHGELTLTCTDVLIDGKSLANGDEFTKRLRLYVMSEADDVLMNGGGLLDDVLEAEGISLSGHPNDPDTYWQAAE